MPSIGHFIGAKEVRGSSGRTADVWEPMTGDVQAKVALASKAEIRAAVENARDAQPKWAATNPQRRARVMMKFLELAQRDYDKLADRLAREHGKTIPDAKGGGKSTAVSFNTDNPGPKGFRNDGPRVLRTQSGVCRDNKAFPSRYADLADVRL
jgi:acyl-CoA reductase-like NAD-dependent aldehyde dehydrogenase